MKYPLLIYKDEKFEDETRNGIEQTYSALKKLWDIWLGLDVGEIDNIFLLVVSADQIYKDSFQSTIKVPAKVGGYDITREQFLDVVEMPEPVGLLAAAVAVQQSPCYGYQHLWSIVDGKVIQDNEGAEIVIHSQNIYAADERQAELAKSIVEYVRLSNFIIQEFKALQWRGIPIPPFTLTGVYLRTINELKLEVEQLRYVLTYGFG